MRDYWSFTVRIPKDLFSVSVVGFLDEGLLVRSGFDFAPLLEFQWLDF